VWCVCSVHCPLTVHCALCTVHCAHHEINQAKITRHQLTQPKQRSNTMADGGSSDTDTPLCIGKAPTHHAPNTQHPHTHTPHAICFLNSTTISQLCTELPTTFKVNNNMPATATHPYLCHRPVLGSWVLSPGRGLSWTRRGPPITIMAARACTHTHTSLISCVELSP
jgi:hypothetical protein